MAKTLINDRDRILFSAVLEWACSRRFESIVTALEGYYSNVATAINAERWMAYSLWRIVAKRELNKYLQGIEMLQHLHSIWPKLITYEEYKRILLEMKTKAILNFMSTSGRGDESIMEMTCKIFPKQLASTEDFSDEESKLLHAEQQLIRHNIINMISDHSLRENFSDHFVDVMKNCQEKLPLEQLVEQYTDKVDSELGECILVKKFYGHLGKETNAYPIGDSNDNRQTTRSPILLSSMSSSSTATLISTPRGVNTKHKQDSVCHDLHEGPSPSIGNSKTSNIYATFSPEEKSSTLSCSDDKLDNVHANNASSTLMLTTQDDVIPPSIVSDESADVLNTAVARSTTETAETHIAGKTMINIATLSKDVSLTSKDAIDVQKGVVKDAQHRSSAIVRLQEQKLKAWSSDAIRMKETVYGKHPQYVIDSSSSCHTEEKQELHLVNDSLGRMEQPTQKSAIDYAFTMSLRSKGRSDQSKSHDSNKSNGASSVYKMDTATNMLRNYSSHNQGSIMEAYENMQVVGYRELPNGTYECVLIGKDKRKSSVFIEPCHVEVVQRRF